MDARPLVRGFAYGATHTPDVAGMRRFFAALGLVPTAVVGATAAMFLFPDGSFFGVVPPDDDGPPDDGTAATDPADDRRIIGFRVTSLAEAAAALEAAGFPVLDRNENALSRYSHVVGPDGRLYELVELLPAPPDGRSAE